MSNRDKYVTVFLVVIAIIALLLSRRHVIITSEGNVYRLDRLTGKTWLLVDDTQLPVTEATPLPVTPPTPPPPTQPQNLLSTRLRQMRQEEALKLAREAHTLSYRSNEDVVSSWLAAQKGSITVHGWEATPKGGPLLVSCTIGRANQRIGFYFEVHPDLKLVRNVNGDPELEKKYGIKPDPELQQWLLRLNGEAADPSAGAPNPGLHRTAGFAIRR